MAKGEISQKNVFNNHLLQNVFNSHLLQKGKNIAAKSILSLIKMLSDASAADSFLKTWPQQKKLLKTSNFSFCHQVSNSFQLLLIQRDFPNKRPMRAYALLALIWLVSIGTNMSSTFKYQPCMGRSGRFLEMNQTLMDI